MPHARTRSATRAQAAEQLSKLAAVARQIEQKRAEADSVTAAIAKVDASMPMLEETATIRRKAMEIQYGNRIAFLEAHVGDGGLVIRQAVPGPAAR